MIPKKLPGPLSNFSKMAKIIVTHFNPDPDSICAVWLIKRFLPGWEKAKVEFVPAGETLRRAPPDEDPEILHVDTGRGKLDHHQRNEYNSAANLVLKKIKNETRLSPIDDEALERLVAIVSEVDNARDLAWEDCQNDRYEFMFPNFVDYFNLGKERKDEEKIVFSFSILEVIFQALKTKIGAEKELKKGKMFRTRWGKAIGVQTSNDQVLQVGEKQGYVLVAKKDPKDGHLRIYARWDRGVDLSRAFGEFKKKDSKATWYLHPSRCLLLNGSRSDPSMVPTELSLEEIVKILKNA